MQLFTIFYIQLLTPFVFKKIYTNKDYKENAIVSMTVKL